MMIYSNKAGMPRQINIYQEKPGEWTEETAAPRSWTQLGTSEDTLSAALSDCVIEHVEPVSYPLTDGILLYVFDRNNKPRILEISIADDFLTDPDNFSGIPLSARLSSVIGE